MKYALDYMEVEIIDKDELIVYRYGSKSGTRFKCAVVQKNWFDTLVSATECAKYPSLIMKKFGGVIRQKIVFRSIEGSCIKFGIVDGLGPLALGCRSSHYATKSTLEALLKQLKSAA